MCRYNRLSLRLGTGLRLRQCSDNNSRHNSRSAALFRDIYYLGRPLCDCGLTLTYFYHLIACFLFEDESAEICYVCSRARWIRIWRLQVHTVLHY